MISIGDWNNILVALSAPEMLLNGQPLTAHIRWSETAAPPSDPEAFALEAIYVICNSRMKHTVARGIFERVKAEMLDGDGQACNVFGHEGKADAMTEIWWRRKDLFAGYLAAEDKVEFCATLPWIGPATKFHLAKNFGVDVVKPDVHLLRLATLHGTTPQALCEDLAAKTGLKARTIDLVLWIACAKGAIDPRRETKED